MNPFTILGLGVAALLFMYAFTPDKKEATVTTTLVNETGDDIDVPENPAFDEADEVEIVELTEDEVDEDAEWYTYYAVDGVLVDSHNAIADIETTEEVERVIDLVGKKEFFARLEIGDARITVLDRDSHEDLRAVLIYGDPS